MLSVSLICISCKKCRTTFIDLDSADGFHDVPSSLTNIGLCQVSIALGCLYVGMTQNLGYFIQAHPVLDQATGSSMPQVMDFEILQSGILDTQADPLGGIPPGFPLTVTEHMDLVTFLGKPTGQDGMYPAGHISDGLVADLGTPEIDRFLFKIDPCLLVIG
jgi:hypothetical protein